MTTSADVEKPWLARPAIDERAARAWAALTGRKVVPVRFHRGEEAGGHYDDDTQDGGCYLRFSTLHGPVDYAELHVTPLGHRFCDPEVPDYSRQPWLWLP